MEEWVRKSAVQPAARLKLASGLGTWLVPVTRTRLPFAYVMQVKSNDISFNRGIKHEIEYNDVGSDRNISTVLLVYDPTLLTRLDLTLPA